MVNFYQQYESNSILLKLQKKISSDVQLFFFIIKLKKIFAPKIKIIYKKKMYINEKMFWY